MKFSEIPNHRANKRTTSCRQKATDVKIHSGSRLPDVKTSLVVLQNELYDTDTYIVSNEKRERVAT